MKSGVLFLTRFQLVMKVWRLSNNDSMVNISLAKKNSTLSLHTLLGQNRLQLYAVHIGTISMLSSPSLSLMTDNEALRCTFAERANQASAYIDAKNATLSDLSIEGKGTLEDQLQALQQFQTEVATYQTNIDECEAANQAAQAAMVFDNPHTSCTMEVSEMEWEEPGGFGLHGGPLLYLFFCSPFELLGDS